MRRFLAIVSFFLAAGIIFAYKELYIFALVVPILLSLTIAFSRKFYNQTFFQFFARSFLLAFEKLWVVYFMLILLLNVIAHYNIANAYIDLTLLVKFAEVAGLLALIFSLTIGMPAHIIKCENNITSINPEDVIYSEDIFERANRLVDRGDNNDNKHFAILSHYDAEEQRTLNP